MRSSNGGQENWNLKESSYKFLFYQKSSGKMCTFLLIFVENLSILISHENFALAAAAAVVSRERNGDEAEIQFASVV